MGSDAQFRRGLLVIRWRDVRPGLGLDYRANDVGPRGCVEICHLAADLRGMKKTILALAALLLSAPSFVLAQTSTLPISALPAASTPLTGQESVPCVQSGATRGCYTAAIASIVPAAVAIAALPACSTVPGARLAINNGIASPTYHQAVSATGTAMQPVFCNGTSWLYD